MGLLGRLGNRVRQLGSGEEKSLSARRHRRYRVGIEGTLDGSPCHIVDLSRGGARVVVAHAATPTVGDKAELAFSAGDDAYRLIGRVLRATKGGLMRSLALEFEPYAKAVGSKLEYQLSGGRHS